ncbi:hypothetical protein OXX59_004397 [Metschnikowia pulcherrima]
MQVYFAAEPNFIFPIEETNTICWDSIDSYKFVFLGHVPFQTTFFGTLSHPSLGPLHSNSTYAAQTSNTQATVQTSTGIATQTSTSASGFLGLLQGIYSAVTSAASSSSTLTDGTSSSGSSWKSFFSSLFGGSSDDSTVTSSSTLSSTTSLSLPTSSVIASSWTSSTSSSSSSSRTQPSATSTSESTSTGGIYDEIYGSSEDIDQKFAKAILDSHNTYRAQHGVGALSWAEGPYSYAKNNADNYDCSGILTHTHGQYGENLAAGFPSGPAAVTAWYVEGETFDFSAYNEYNHFTQLVWKDTTKVGCAYKDCSAEGWQLYVVCEYDPVGNVIGQEQQNVLPLVS